jgi:hypothetical protein
MFSNLSKAIFFALEKVFRSARSSSTENAGVNDLNRQFQAAEEKGWWQGMTGLVGPTDQQLVVIGPRSDLTTAELQELGHALERW